LPEPAGDVQGSCIVPLTPTLSHQGRGRFWEACLARGLAQSGGACRPELFPHAGDGGNKLPNILLETGNVIRIQSFCKQIAGKQFQQHRQLQDTLFRACPEAAPSFHMLFRPKEVHCASGIWQIFEPVPERHGCVRHQALGFRALDFPVLHIHADR
jgi:hypothetical protein